MPLVLVGIDEAGYGPLLGPLCVGAAAIRIDDWSPGMGAPDLWKLLSSCVCKKPGDKRARIAVDDSKKLKLANSHASKHPLTHLERAVLTFLACTDHRPESDDQLLRALGAQVERHEWYATDPAPCPIAATRAGIDIAANVLSAGLRDAGVQVLDLRCAVVGESRFNQTVRTTGTKAAATALALGDHLRHAWNSWSRPADDPDALRIVCDRQGGRTDYAAYLAELLPGKDVRAIDESPERSRYEVRGAAADGSAHSMVVLFQPEAESSFLTVALASMAAKLVRETLMARFNRYWCARVPELKPTAGYTLDARRWLSDMRSVLTDAERQAMIRIA